ncbi:MAG: L-threonylcarbamoyladenylate synthase [Oscillospiraceae bacterium]|nr:L-threonylcarbamoyladenylate synthase [Oscillospiraceae bacterium]MDD4414602.1 L-threonylcarbamoyladenylate synthase [Oscillospiraceae bacterium]
MNLYETCLLKGNEKGIKKAAELLRSGETVAIPTETVYGLAANALDDKAVRRIFEAKGRPRDNPLIVHISDINRLDELVADIPKSAMILADKYWPGPLTMIFNRSLIIPDSVSAGLSTVAVRMPSHPVARAIIKEADIPLAAPSANRSGSPSPTTAAHVLHDMRGRIPAVVDGGECIVGVESTVVDLTGNQPKLLRPGGITPEMLISVLGGLQIHPAVKSRLPDDEPAVSPGLKYKHYSPKADVVLVKAAPDRFADFVNSQKREGTAAMCFDGEEGTLQVPFVTYGSRHDLNAQARRVFDALRRLDDIGAATVYCSCPDEKGIGLAVYNRLLRATGYEVIELD